MPLSDCRIMLVTLEKYKSKFNAAKVDTKIYGKEQLRTISQMHQLLEVKKKIEEEVIWINNYSYTVPLECHRISQETLSEFTQVLSNGFNDTCVSKTFPNLPKSCDICLLTCNGWFSYSTIQVFLELLNKLIANVKFILFSMIQYISYDALKKLLKSWRDQGVASCCAVVNICLGERGSTLEADSKNLGNHWDFVHVRFHPNLWVYADTLGYPVPKNLSQCLENPNNAVGLIHKWGIYDEPNLIITHFDDASNERQCTSSCIKYFLSQRNDMDLCGPASIVSAIVLSNDTFLSGILKAKSPLKRFSWLCILGKYSEFIRKVLVPRFVKREVDLSLLNMG